MLNRALPCQAVAQGTLVTSRTEPAWSSLGLSEGHGECLVLWDIMFSELLSPETQVDTCLGTPSMSFQRCPHLSHQSVESPDSALSTGSPTPTMAYP